MACIPGSKAKCNLLLGVSFHFQLVARTFRAAVLKLFLTGPFYTSASVLQWQAADLTFEEDLSLHTLFRELWTALIRFNNLVLSSILMSSNFEFRSLVNRSLRAPFKQALDKFTYLA